jgi:hypothetical protein
MLRPGTDEPMPRGNERARVKREANENRNTERREFARVSGGSKLDSCGGRKSDSRQHRQAAG